MIPHGTQAPSPKTGSRDLLVTGRVTQQYALGDVAGAIASANFRLSEHPFLAEKYLFSKIQNSGLKISYFGENWEQK